MATHLIEKGLDLPISGEAVQVMGSARVSQRVAVVAADFPGMKPGMRVAEGDTVKRGQILFEDRKAPGVLHAAPGAGRVVGVHRGAKRALQSVVIDLSDGELSGSPPAGELESFPAYTGGDVASLSRDQIVSLLVESGQWTALRARPFSKVPTPESQAHSIFVTAIDTNPLAPLPDVVVGRRRDDFERGLAAVAKLSSGKTHLCVAPHSDIVAPAEAGIELEVFEGPHPAGNVGTHIHRIDAVGREKVVWHLGYQDVIAIGHLFATGQLDVERIVTIAGPAAPEPVLVPVRLGADVEEAVGEIPGDDELRLVSGSVLSGRTAMGEVHGFLGRYHNQITVIREGRERVFLGWLTPGWNAFSNVPIYLSRLLGRKNKFAFTTTTNGSPRAMVPIGMYERVMPMDILPTFLLRALVVGDIEQAEKLGALELDEEDLALCTFVCPGKGEYGRLLRLNLEMIEKEG
jgi:Na+-transporting NADH:ubiquinone oxidoreductase subunit A